MRSHFPTLSRVATALVLGLLLPTGPAHGQGITGSVIDEETGGGITGAHLVLRDSTGEARSEAVSGDGGAFALPVPRAGAWTLHVTALGYAPLVSEPIFATPDEQVIAEVLMTVQAIELEQRVVVSERRSHGSPDLHDFQERRKQGARTGVGRFITRSEVERLAPARATQLLQAMSGVRVGSGVPGRGRLIRMTRGCIPAIYVDGVHVNVDRRASLDEYVTPPSIEGIEVYRGGHQQVGRFRDPFGCGLVLVWTRRGDRSGDGFSWVDLGIGASILLALFLMR